MVKAVLFWCLLGMTFIAALAYAKPVAPAKIMSSSFVEKSCVELNADQDRFNECLRTGQAQLQQQAEERLRTVANKKPTEDARKKEFARLQAGLLNKLSRDCKRQEMVGTDGDEYPIEAESMSSDLGETTRLRCQIRSLESLELRAEKPRKVSSNY